MSKHIIIGPGGMGLAIAGHLRQQGADVHIIGRDASRVAAAASTLQATHAVADVTDSEALTSAVEAAGPAIEGLAYCVGTITLKPAHRLTDADIMRDFEINALGAWRAVRAALPALKVSAQPTSSILLFSTIAVAQGFTAHASIGMAKAAVEGLTRSLAAELAPKIRVNAIAPSLTKTALSTPLTSNETMANSIASLHPLQRLGEAEDIAAMGALLLSSASSWITGQVIGIDGGRSVLRTKG
jgi:NAD(P)-dependent dehydrogenase (short-subunit alcohol dehydrogenase family)